MMTTALLATRRYLTLLAALAAAATSAACFDAPTPACAFYCSAAGECPDGYACASDQWCKRSDLADSYECGPGPADAAPPPNPDASTPDAGPPDANSPDAAAPDASSPDAASAAGVSARGPTP